MKVCNKCGESKSFESFPKRKKRDGSLTFRGECKFCQSEYNKNYRQINKDYFKEYDLKYSKDNSAKKVENAKVWKKRNIGKVNAITAKRRASKLQATPSWLSEKDQKQIKRIYTACSNVSERTGKPHHVDHIVPLQGENVCGLHVPWNLAIIPASMNLSKSNKF